MINYISDDNLNKAIIMAFLWGRGTQGASREEIHLILNDVRKLIRDFEKESPAQIEI